MVDLTTSLSRSDGTATLVLNGDLDVSSVPRLRDVVQQALATGEPNVELDLGDVGFVDSTGLGVLIGAQRRAEESGQRFVLVSVSPSLQRVLDLTGVREMLTDDPS